MATTVAVRHHRCSTASQPVCLTSGPSSGACVQCTTAKASYCTGTTPICDATTDICVACNGNYGSGQSHACTNAAAPVCLGGACVQCASSLDCSGTTPVCDTTTICVACNGDFGSSGHTRPCPLSSTPACNTSGALTGACTQCSSGNTSLCVAPDQCHQSGTCNTTTGLCTFPNKTDGTACNDGNLCTQTDTCQSGTCTGGNPVVCSALDQCHDAGVCHPSTGVCTNPIKTDGTGCNDGNACTQTDTCQSGTCTGSNPVVCPTPDQCHDAGVCNTGTGVCSNPNKTDGTACNDGNACTHTDTCQTGVCTGSNPVVCTALDQCHDVGVCNTSTGICSNPNKTDGTACNDGNACTLTDICQAGTCIGGNPVVCSALDQCHQAGVCDPISSLCSDPIQPNGTACNDGNACTQTDTCQSGTCSGSNPVVCSALDQCHDAGVCNTGTGVCSNPNKIDGTACNDGNACTHTDTCQTGACTGSNPVVCTALDQCHNVGVCNTSTGICSNPNKTDGTACNDSNACTQTDTCQSGTCTGTNPILCTPIDQCHQTGVCDPISSLCSDPIQPNGTTCNDGNACTQTDACQSGTCSGSNPVVCSALDQCHDAGVCNTGTGICSNPNKTAGTACNDGNACTHTDTCQTGVCTGGNPVVCSALDQCHDVGVCNTTTGACSNPAKSDGTACSDSNDCTQTDTCQSGACTGSNSVVCPTPDQCHTAGTCDPGTGICSNPTKPDGTGCSDGDACTYPDTCQAGTCVAANSIVCVAQDECHDPGSCDPSSGRCSNPVKADDTPCALGLGSCLAGVCKSNDGQPCTDASACTSTYCVDGYCCDQTCTGQCEACNLPGALGHCGPVTGTPQSPRPACTAVDPACAGQCDGTRRIACTYPGTETQCRQAQCVDEVATQAESCNGTGACPPIQTQICDPYVCGPSLCRGDCLVDQDCVTGYFCATGICQQTLPPGQLCDRNVQCISGHCVDNVCCDLPCTGQCEACNLIASLGTCSAVTGAPVGARPPCDSDGGTCSGQCDGLRHDGCSYPGSDQECRPASCQSDLATVRAVCDGAGSCPPLHTQPCIPYRCGDTQCNGNCLVDGDCASGYWCSVGVCIAKHDIGTDCVGDNECLSGFCADGVCCDSTCLGQCQACNLENHRGSCTPVTGAPQPGHAPCAGTGAMCGGNCDGITADRCSYPGAETVCRPASCHVEVDVGIATLQASCDSAGHCPDILQQNCAPYTCTGVVCTQSCATEPCPNDQYCSAGLCVLKIPQGDTCDSAAHCLSGFCVDGVCCESACTGQCEACNLETHVGYCWPVTGVPNGGRAPCVGSGVCQGTCDGITRNVCAFPGSTAICQNGNCSSGIASAAATCDGAGSCAQAAMQSCGAYVCGETTCKTACTADKDCGDAYYCVHSRCADHIETSGGGCGCGTGGADRSGLLLVLLGLVVLAIKRRVR